MFTKNMMSSKLRRKKKKKPVKVSEIQFSSGRRVAMPGTICPCMYRCRYTQAIINPY